MELWSVSPKASRSRALSCQQMLPLRVLLPRSLSQPLESGLCYDMTFYDTQGVLLEGLKVEARLTFYYGLILNF